MTGLVWFLIILAIVLAIWVVGMFNRLVVLKNRVAEADSDVDVQLKRRHNLIPNIVNTVKGYATHESEVFERVTQARSAAVGAASGNMQNKAQAENALTSTLRSLFAVAENYPQLRANENFLALQEELSDTENKIMSARRFYNTNVKDFNTRQEVFPSSLIAKLFNFKKSELFELTDIAEREVPHVDFSEPQSQ
ncbi:hypothetical protein A2V68_01845 [candidate division Kazan bacterium RBG_13_50_9]|uniref:LemA family protein n=1 Tax=candidate division Kazan bacterium RBG_13_50_9 TaxID=1798535 RepID=A0A1F4NSJ2_UNCK3|nr:MAG: hypothetical protein A2V68_01845 [candidate division Kazan bacterium RBG_13_50_9]